LKAVARLTAWPVGEAIGDESDAEALPEGLALVLDGVVAAVEPEAVDEAPEPDDVVGVPVVALQAARTKTRPAIAPMSPIRRRCIRFSQYHCFAIEGGGAGRRTLDAGARVSRYESWSVPTPP
jgi:hypothetical protein